MWQAARQMRKQMQQSLTLACLLALLRVRGLRCAVYFYLFCLFYSRITMDVLLVLCLAMLSRRISGCCLAVLYDFCSFFSLHCFVLLALRSMFHDNLRLGLLCGLECIRIASVVVFFNDFEVTFAVCCILKCVLLYSKLLFVAQRYFIYRFQIRGTNEKSFHFAKVLKLILENLRCRNEALHISLHLLHIQQFVLS